MPVIDTHTHFFPPEWIDLLEREGSAHGVTLGRNNSGAVTFACPGIRQVGVDHIVMGSDYCFQIGDEHPVATVNRLSKSISVAEREMILGKTAARLLKL